MKIEKNNKRDLSDSEKLIVSQFNDFLAKEQAKFDIIHQSQTPSKTEVSSNLISKRQKIFEENLTNVKKNLKNNSIISRKKHRQIVWYKKLVAFLFNIDYNKAIMPKTKSMVSQLSTFERFRYRLSMWIIKK